MKAPIHFSDIIVIYNPNSTGFGKKMAKEFKSLVPSYKVRLFRTNYAGHAEKLAYTFAKSSRRPLIISASGDGGYHEIVNGLMRAQLEGAHPTAGLLPAGNANDHYHDVHRTDIAKAVMTGKVHKIDLLTITMSSHTKSITRYAHSYIGFGLTPKVGKELNKVKLNWFNEIWIVIKALLVLQPVKILVDGKQRVYDSIIFSNVSKMSKVLSLSSTSTNDDGKFEITIFKRRNKLRLLKLLVKASTSGLTGLNQNESYSFETIKETLVQADGEIATVDAHSEVVIGIEHKVLQCIV